MLPGVSAEASLLSRWSLQRSHAELLEEERQAEAELSRHTHPADGEPGVADGTNRFSLPCTVTVAPFHLDFFFFFHLLLLFFLLACHNGAVNKKR